MLQQEFNPPIEQPADELDLALTLEFEIQAVSNEDLRALAEGVLDANIPDNQQAVPDTVAIENLSEPVLSEDQLAHWRILASRQIQAKLEETQASYLIRALKPGAAVDLLHKSLPLDTQPTVRLFPSWWPRLPMLPFRMTIKTLAPGG